ncbi:MAG: AzlD domain-containing protein [Sphaerochaetaceae bacterium]
MKNLPMYLIVLVAGVATMIPRFIPFYLSFLNKVPPFVKKCMKLLPVTAIGALIFPYTILDFFPVWYAGLLGVLAAFLVNFLKPSMLLSIIVSVIVTYIALLV